MKQIPIELDGIHYTALILSNADFEIICNDEVIGKISPNLIYQGIIWLGKGLDDKLAQQLGEQIEKYEL